MIETKGILRLRTKLIHSLGLASGYETRVLIVYIMQKQHWPVTSIGRHQDQLPDWLQLRETAF